MSLFHRARCAVPVLVLALTATLCGCASQLLSDDRLRSNTAGALGLPANELTISERREEMPNTYYTVKTSAGAEFNCVINGGGVLAAGMVNPPNCAKKGQVPNTKPPFAR